MRKLLQEVCTQEDRRPDTIIIGNFDDHPGAPIEEHLKWIEKELTPPIECGREVVYVLKCFRQALVLLRSRQMGEGRKLRRR